MVKIASAPLEEVGKPRSGFPSDSYFEFSRGNTVINRPKKNKINPFDALKVLLFKL